MRQSGGEQAHQREGVSSGLHLQNDGGSKGASTEIQPKGNLRMREFLKGDKVTVMTEGNGSYKWEDQVEAIVDIDMVKLYYIAEPFHPCELAHGWADED